MAYTPMIEQYLEVKDKYRSYILFYRLGDFYEMFFEDAQLVSHELELTLTGKDCGEGQRAPMCGVPYHAAETYIGRLIALGYKVAICEQTEDPALAKGLVKREVIRVITPGTIIESDLLSDGKNNYFASVYTDGRSAGIAFVDISTAYVCATSFAENISENLLSEITTYAPREIISNAELSEYPEIAEYMKLHPEIYVTEMPDAFDESAAMQSSNEHFGSAAAVEGDRVTAVIAAGAALRYITENQLIDLSYIKNIDLYENNNYLEIDTSTRRNLEMTETMLTKEKRGSLLWVLDKTSTAMGARLLRSWLEHPLTSVPVIQKRQSAVGEMQSDFMLREEIKEVLAGILDLERLMTRVNYGSAGGRELRAVAQTVACLPKLRDILSRVTSSELKRIHDEIDPLEDIYKVIDDAIVDEPPFQVKEGGIIKRGYNGDADELRMIVEDSEGIVREIEAREKEKTGIKNLRIRSNSVFGYYIEIVRSQSDTVPDDYIRKQTLKNCERFITKELKETETKIFGASDKLQKLEYELFCEVRQAVADESARIRATAEALAKLDAYVSLGECASQNNYVCPEIDMSDKLVIKDGRHPVVERFVKDSYFVPNDAELDTDTRRMMLITGPNMAGKSTYMRQCALIVLMAQMGSFVPASYARIGIVDKLFTRVGASDDLAAGQSTFMLEMKEVSAILTKATRRSFIIYDEIGRGTSTFDGMSIARAVAEYTASKKLGAKAMFATHYHELTCLEDELEGVVNYNVAVKKRGEELIFLRKIVCGAVDQSYGIEVARLAGIPKEIVKRARTILEGLENEGSAPPAKSSRKSENDTDEVQSFSFSDIMMQNVKEALMSTDLNVLTPIEAMNLIYNWKKSLTETE